MPLDQAAPDVRQPGERRRFPARICKGSSDPRAALLREAPERAWQQALAGVDSLRFARLMAYVRTLEPEENLNGSILVFELTDAEVALALGGAALTLGGPR